jgi:hypothetical protein
MTLPSINVEASSYLVTVKSVYGMLHRFVTLSRRTNWHEKVQRPAPPAKKQAPF